MKTKEIINVIDAGILNATGHSLPEEEYYKFFRFKRTIRKIYDEFAAAEAALLKEVGFTSDEMRQVNGKIVLAPLKKDGTPDTSRLSKYQSAIRGLLDEEVKLENQERIPVNCYKALYDENRKEVNGAIVDIFSSHVIEDFVIDNLFSES